MTFNTNIAQWGTLQKVFVEKGIQFWDVTKQWSATPQAKKYPSKPFAMILIKAHRQIVILVWGNHKYYSIEEKHSISKIITEIEAVVRRSPKITPVSEAGLAESKKP